MNNLKKHSKLPHQAVIITSQLISDTNQEKITDWFHIKTENGIGINLIYSKVKTFQIIPTHIKDHISIIFYNGIKSIEIFNGLKVDGNSKRTSLVLLKILNNLVINNCSTQEKLDTYFKEFSY